MWRKKRGGEKLEGGGRKGGDVGGWRKKGRREEKGRGRDEEEGERSDREVRKGEKRREKRRVKA